MSARADAASAPSSRSASPMANWMRPAMLPLPVIMLGPPTTVPAKRPFSVGEHKPTGAHPHENWLREAVRPLTSLHLLERQPEVVEQLPLEAHAVRADA